MKRQMKRQTKNKKVSFNLKGFATVWVVIITVIVTSLIIGGGVYFYQSLRIEQIKSELSNLQGQVTDLQSKISQRKVEEMGVEESGYDKYIYEIKKIYNTDAEKDDNYLISIDKNTGEEKELLYLNEVIPNLGNIYFFYDNAVAGRYNNLIILIAGTEEDCPLRRIMWKYDLETSELSELARDSRGESIVSNLGSFSPDYRYYVFGEYSEIIEERNSKNLIPDLEVRELKVLDVEKNIIKTIIKLKDNQSLVWRSDCDKCASKYISLNWLDFDTIEYRIFSSEITRECDLTKGEHVRYEFISRSWEEKNKFTVTQPFE